MSDLGKSTTSDASGERSQPEIDFGVPKVLTRRWIAWKLVQLAYRICNTEYYERIAVYNEKNLVAEWIIVGDLYGNGVSSQFAPGATEAEETKGIKVVYDDDYKPDWLEDK